MKHKKLMQIMKGAAALCMCAVVVMAGSLTAYAAYDDVVDTTRTGSLTIHKYDTTAADAAGVDVSDVVSTGERNEDAEKALADYAVKGVEFTYLRVGDVKTLSENGNVKLIYQVPDELKEIIGLGEGVKDGWYTGQQINDAMAKALEENTVTKDALEEYVKGGTAMSLTDVSGATTENGLDLGLYLIVETKAPEDVVDTTNPWFVQLPMTDYTGDYWFYDVVCYPKNQTGVPTLDKRVRNNPDQSNVVTASKEEGFTSAREEYAYGDTVTATESEVLDYELISKLPHITSKATYLSKYTFTDTLSKGITYGRDAVIAFYDSTDAFDSTNKNNVETSGSPAAVWAADSGKFTQEYTDGENGSSVMTVKMTDSGLEEINKNYSDKYIVMYYTATLNSDDTVTLGDNGNPNDVTLEWRRTSSEHYDVLKDRCEVYTYGIDLTKKFSDSKGDASKVQFVLQNTSDDYFLKGEKASDGLYYIIGKAAAEEDATQFSPASDGKLVIQGIEADIYAMTETHSDTGYSLLKEPMVIHINATSAKITPTAANITGIQSKPGNDSTANDGNVKGDELAGVVSVQKTKADADVDGSAAVMENCKNDTSSESALVAMEVLNTKGFLLPQTGGNGIYFFAIAGLAIAACAAFGTKKKKG